MVKDRVPIPDALAAAVLFASDRTCCVCRLATKVQIHHIDEDPSNNAFDNLAVICLHCHSEAHTTGAFVRNLTPDLIRLYNSSWRQLVQGRVKPAEEKPANFEVMAEAFLEASLDCHRWKMHFMYYVGPENLQLHDESGEFTDVWDLMEARWLPQYSELTYRQFFPLFAGLSDVQHRFDRVNQLFGDVLPQDFRLHLIRAHRQLETMRSSYPQVPALIAAGVPADGLFRSHFAQVIWVLRDLSRDADARRESLGNAQR